MTQYVETFFWFHVNFSHNVYTLPVLVCYFVRFRICLIFQYYYYRSFYVDCFVFFFFLCLIFFFKNASIRRTEFITIFLIFHFNEKEKLTTNKNQRKYQTFLRLSVVAHIVCVCVHLYYLVDGWDLRPVQTEKRWYFTQVAWCTKV